MAGDLAEEKKEKLSDYSMLFYQCYLGPLGITWIPSTLANGRMAIYLRVARLHD